VPEISARDLRRLETLEGRLVKAEDARKELAAARRELRAAVTAEARRAQAAGKEAAAAGEQLEAILAENAALAARLDEVSADVERLQAASLELRTQLDTTRGDLEKALEAVKQAQLDLSAAQAERDGLAENLKLANEQLAGKEMTPVLPAQEVAKLVDRFVSELGSGTRSLVVREGEVRLQVAFGKVGQATGFVVPSAESPPEIGRNLHEVMIRFDRTLEAPGR
jgi:chromosome segregation ATPase